MLSWESVSEQIDEAEITGDPKLRVELAGHGRPQDYDREAERVAVEERGLARAHQVLPQLCQSRKSWSSARR